MTSAERLARGIHAAYGRTSNDPSRKTPTKAYETLSPPIQAQYVAVATDLLDNQPDLLWSVLRERWPAEGTQHPTSVTQQPTAFMEEAQQEPNDVHVALFGRVLAALCAILDGLDAFADEDRPDPTPEQWVARLSEAREALTYGLLSRLTPPPTEGESW